jgi:hypothetical protein
MGKLERICRYLLAKKALIEKSENYKIEVNCKKESIKISFTEFDNLEAESK